MRKIFFVVAALLSAACSPRPGGGTGGGTESPAGGMGGGQAGNQGGGQGGGADQLPATFPSKVPMQFGYQLRDTFNGVQLWGAMDMEWPKGSSEPFV
ncbi:MAG: hypothetical protein JNK82_24955, partial [Myxococcaceae bacterium]|nr:hypothetical protein [Myxococcaceae bacterium]